MIRAYNKAGREIPYAIKNDDYIVDDKKPKETRFQAWGELTQAIEVLDDLVNRLTVGVMADAGKNDRQCRFGLTDARHSAMKLHGILVVLKDHIDPNTSLPDRQGGQD